MGYHFLMIHHIDNISKSQEVRNLGLNSQEIYLDDTPMTGKYNAIMKKRYYDQGAGC